MAGRNLKPGSGGFDSSDKVNSNTLKRHPKMDLSRNDLLQLLSYLEGELQARDVVIATLKAEKAKQLLYQAKYGRFGLGDPFSAMQRDSDNMKDNTFDESAIKSMYDNQLAQLENLIATQRKAQMKMREQMLTGEKRYQKVCSELDDEKRKHAQDTAQGDDVTYMLEKERERLKQEVDFEKANTKKMEKDLKKTLVSLEEERASSAKHKQVALMLIKERKKLVEKMIMEKQKADQAEKLLHEERNKAMNMAEGLVQESKKSLKMEATMERQLSEFDLEREQMKNKLHREENRTKDLQLQLDSLKWQVENLQKQSGKLSKEPTHSVEIKSNVSAPHTRLSSERTPTWQASGSSVTNMLSNTISGKSNPMKLALDTNAVEREAGLSPRHSSSELSVRKRDNTRYASPQPVSIERSGSLQYSDNNLETRVAPVGAVSDKSLTEPQSVQKLNVSGSGGSTIVSSGGRITVQTGSPTPTSGPVSPRRAVSIGRGVPPPIPPNKPVLPATTLSKSSTTKVGAGGSKSVHIPVSVVHTTSVSTTPGNRASKREGSPSTLRKPAQLSDCQPLPEPQDATPNSPNSDSFDFLGPEMADLQQLLVSMVTVPQDSPGMNNSSSSLSSSSSQTDSVSSSSSSSSSEVAAKTSSVEIIDSSTSASMFVQTPPLTSQYQVPDISLPPETSPTSMPVSSSPLTSGISRLSFTQSAVLTKSLDFTSQSSKSVAESGQSSSLTKSLDFSTPLPSNPVGSSLLLQRSTVSGITIPSLKPIVSVDTPTSPIHRYAAIGNIESLRKLIVDLEADVNLPMKDGTTPTHCAAENGQLDCLQLLIERRCNVNGLRDDQLSPVHCAAAQGHAGCLSLLLTHGGNVNITDQSSWTPLHWSAFNGHYECCKQLLKYGADRTALSNTNWTPCHMAVHSDNVNCLDLLLTFMTDQSDSLEKDRLKVIRINDKDGWTLAHYAASKESHDCLSVILSHCDIDLMCTDLWGRSVLDVSSSHCHQLLVPYVNNERLKHVTVELCCTGSLYAQQQPFVIGLIQILPNMDWKNVDTALNCLVENYFSQIDRGLRTKKTSRLDPEVGVENTPLCLGLTSDSILGYSVGSFSWIKDGSYPDISPQEIMCNNNIPAITVNIKGSEIENDSLAFDLLLPVSTINNYVRLLDQYKCVVFYGPEGTRKKQLVKRLARHVSEKESMSSCGSQVVQVYLHRDYTFHNFVKLLKTENCLLPVDMESERPCILLLFHLEKVQLAHMLGSLLDHIDFRGNQHTFNLPGADGVQDMYYFAKDFYLIATMDKPRSTGLDLGLQQRFRWVQFRINVEPVRNLLARHFLRRLIHTFGGLLPSIDSAIFKAVEWLVCVWQRLNDGVSKLGLPDVVFGPDMFLPCPIESQDAPAVLDWLTKLWNETISPVVRSAVLRGTGKDGTEDGQQKVANTALFVLMQRTIVPGCPVTGDEKDKYLSAFSGSNELDVSLKMDKASPDGGGNYGHRRPLHKGSSRSSVHITGSRPKHRNSTGTDGSVYLTHGNASVKRRSLSENFNRTEEVEIPIVHQQSEQTNHLQAKVPKLEIRSPVLGLTIPLPNTFSPTGRTSPLTSMSMNSENSSNHRRATFSSHSRIPQPVVSSKRSRSSENLNNDSHLSAPRGGNQFRPTSPFSFSLTTPTSSLFSFKFISDESGKSKNLTSSPKIVNSALKS